MQSECGQECLHSVPYSSLAKSLVVAIVCALFAACERPPPGGVRILTDETFDSAIAKGVVLVEFWGNWCVPCVTQRVIVAEIAAEVSGKKVVVAHLDLGFEEARKKVQHLNIDYVPTLIVFKKGKPFKTFVGLTQKEELLDAVNEAQATK